MMPIAGMIAGAAFIMLGIIASPLGQPWAHAAAAALIIIGVLALAASVVLALKDARQDKVPVQVRLCLPRCIMPPGVAAFATESKADNFIYQY